MIILILGAHEPKFSYEHETIYEIPIHETRFLHVGYLP